MNICIILAYLLNVNKIVGLVYETIAILRVYSSSLTQIEPTGEGK